MATASAPTGVLLVNLGTPDAPRAREVRRYLRQFLSDPRVIDIGAVARWVLLEGFILPFRPARSAEAYRKIWRPEGSPLLIHGRALEQAVARELGPGYRVVLGMRYGSPSIERGLESLLAEGADRVVVLPLYPQMASSSTGSSLEAVFDAASKRWNVPSLHVVPPFFDDPGFLRAWSSIGRRELDGFRADQVLFSFHGLPERQVRKADDTGAHCLASDDCCARISTENRNCYRAQSYETARRLAGALDLRMPWSVAFQSRLGRTPWIRPYTDEVVRQLARGGTRRLLVFCPGFVADCLETLEEIGIRAREDFLAQGGEDLRLVPSLNAEPEWTSAVAALVRRAAGERQASALPSAVTA